MTSSSYTFNRTKTGNHSVSYDQKADTKTEGFVQTMIMKKGQIFKSWISWRIAFSVFLTILTIQAVILNFTLKEVELTKLNEIKSVARAAIAPMLDQAIRDSLTSPLSAQAVKRLTDNTLISGLTVYSNELDPLKIGSDKLIPIQNYGEILALNNISRDNLSRTYRSQNGSAYEFILSSNDIQRNYTIAVRADASNVQSSVFDYVMQTITTMLLMSALVTTVLMITIGSWLLEPILFMRSNLLEASKNPENPTIPKSPFRTDDEIGNAITAAQELIFQNADNIKRIKNTAENKIHKLAYFDTLTTLPNRTSFLQSMSENMRANEDGSTQRFAVVALDIDHFKDINDSMGHNVGDAILRSVGKRLRSAMPDTVVVSRTGEDEFAIMAPIQSDAQKPRDIAERIINVVRTDPFKIFNEEFQVRASVGVAVFPRDGTDPDQVLKNADIALNRAKEEGRNSFKEYSEDFDRAVQARFQMLRDLRDAMEQNQLKLHYQPQLDLRTGKIIAAEALLRWWKPDNSKEGGSYISPAEFIPIAEQSGLILPIGAWVLERATSDAAMWNDIHGLDLRVAVNVSAAQFSQGDLRQFTADTLENSKLPAHKLELEVTESVFMDDISHTIQTLKNLHELGVELAIDDFGTGYSSLSYLRQFPIDRLKIDQSFIRNALNEADDAAIASTIVTLGHSLNLKVIAEGVESKEHEAFLIAEGCDEVQGFRYSKAIPHDEFVEFCQTYDGDLNGFNKS